jgi:hypothetical protein
MAPVADQIIEPLAFSSALRAAMGNNRHANAPAGAVRFRLSWSADPETAFAS